MPNKIYRAVETCVEFSDPMPSGSPSPSPTESETDLGCDQVDLSLANLGANSGRISAQYDRGPGSQPVRHKVRGRFVWQTAPAQDETVEIYIAESDGNDEDGDVGVSDAAISDKNTLKNLKIVGPVTAESATANKVFTASFITNIYARYYSVGVWNQSAADNLRNVRRRNKVIVTPMPPEIQD